MLTLQWSATARDQFNTIADYIGEYSPSAVDHLIERFEICAERLTQYPYMYRAGRVAGTREALVHPNYLMIYRVTDEQIIIMRVLHTRQQYP